MHRSVNFLKKTLITVLALAIFIGGFYVFWLSPRYVVPILMYHHFGYDKSTLFVRPDNFTRQMEYLKEKGYRVISLDQLIEGIKEGRKFNRRSVVITIDDGYEDNFIYAYPVLKRYDFPATIFIIANFMGNKVGYMDWKQIKIISWGNISFGAHTKNEAYLPSLKTRELLWDEIAGSKKIIQKKLGKSVDYFCYPTGGFTEEIKLIVEEAGYKGACTTNRGFAELNKDLYELKRIKITNSDTVKPFHFWAKLSGYYNLFRSRKKGN